MHKIELLQLLPSQLEILREQPSLQSLKSLKHYLFKISKSEPIPMEGSIHIWATSKHKARKKIRRYGVYHIDEIKVLD